MPELRERYDLEHSQQALETAIQHQKEGNTSQAIFHLAQAIARVADHIRAKERGDI